jgi:curved DNA-binding protein CbpA
MSFKIEQGLFTLDFTDYHAILGVPVDAEIKDIRKRYLNIARRLHPDSCGTEDEADRQRASDFLSKLVNPAYEKLSQERNYNEYLILLKLKGQQASRQQDTVLLISNAARQLAAASDIDQTYRTALKDLADKQYQALQQTVEVIGHISELNLVYLMRKQGLDTPAQAKAGTSAAASKAPGKPPAAPPKERAKERIEDANIRRAAEFERQNDYNKAIQELREALTLNPKNSDCHTRLGVIYLKTNQATMAKIHFNQALKLNPQDPVALEGKRRTEPAANGTKAANPKEAKAQKPASKDNKSDQSGGGLFGLFGSKKK